VTRKVDSSGTVSFAGTNYGVGSKYRRLQVEIAVVGATVEIRLEGRPLRTHPARHDPAKEHGAYATPGAGHDERTPPNSTSLHIVPDDAWIELPPANADLRYHGVDTNMSRLIAAHPRIGERFGALFLETMFGEGVLAYEERELVAGVTAAAQDCVY